MKRQGRLRGKGNFGGATRSQAGIRRPRGNSVLYSVGASLLLWSTGAVCLEAVSGERYLGLRDDMVFPQCILVSRLCRVPTVESGTYRFNVEEVRLLGSKRGISCCASPNGG